MTTQTIQTSQHTHKCAPAPVQLLPRRRPRGQGALPTRHLLLADLQQLARIVRKLARVRCATRRSTCCVRRHARMADWHVARLSDELREAAARQQQTDRETIASLQAEVAAKAAAPSASNSGDTAAGGRVAAVKRELQVAEQAQEQGPQQISLPLQTRKEESDR